MLTLVFRKLGQIKCKALWVVISGYFSHLQKREREKMQPLLYYGDVFSTPWVPRLFLTVHYLQSKSISRLCSTAVMSVMGCSRPHTVRGFSFLTGLWSWSYSSHQLSHQSEIKHRHRLVWIIKLEEDVLQAEVRLYALLWFYERCDKVQHQTAR